MKKFGLTAFFCLLILSGIYFLSQQNHLQPDSSRIVVITLDSDNLIYLDGQRISFANLLKEIDDIRNTEPLVFEIRSEAGSCIYRINDLTRFLHPDPVQFAHAGPDN